MTERLETIFARKRELETRAKLLREVEAMKSAKLSADIVDLTKLFPRRDQRERVEESF